MTIDDKIRNYLLTKIYVNRTESIITFKIKAMCYLQRLTPKTSHSQPTKIILVHFNILKYGLLIKILNH